MNVPAQRPLAKYQSHEHNVCPHAHGAEAEYDGGLGDATRVALEHLCRVRRDIAGSADAEAQVGPYHRYGSTCNVSNEIIVGGHQSSAILLPPLSLVRVLLPVTRTFINDWAAYLQILPCEPGLSRRK
jgi:hypothetical protein